MIARASLAVLCVAQSALAADFFWPDITNVFSFGDSYTDSISRIVNGSLSPPNDAGTAGGGRMWIEFVAQTYNVSAVNLYNFAYGGAVTDETLIAQSSPATQSFKDQVDSFLEFYANNTELANWDANNTLVTAFFGINDVGKSFWWTNETVEETNARVLASYFERLALLRDAGARNFLLLEVPNIGRTPNLIKQGLNGTLQANASADYNTQLAAAVPIFEQNSTDVGTPVNIKIHPTREVFDFLLDNSDVLGFQNVTAGWWTGLSTELQGEVSLATYFWWNNFHPSWGVHDFLGHSVAAFLTKWSGL
ncbi:carbohydrate esterase family 16 protein [Peniophora sp. CONT]|nr:carbohydrate esterase family 16 protein [Peniophora sp. CONT]